MKMITITEELLQKAWVSQKKKIMAHRTGLQSSKIEIDLSSFLPSRPKSKPTIAMTGDVFMKMQALINGTTEEIGWHGIVKRYRGPKFLIEDIKCYPQCVTATTTTTDEEEYTKWNMALSDTAVQQMRFQGHSHVNMGTQPSPTDLEYYDSILKLLPKNDFYIFAILNKRGDMTWLLYDLKTNIIYEDKDLDVQIVNSKGVRYKVWAEENLEKYVKKAYKMYGQMSDKYYYPTTIFEDSSIYDMVPTTATYPMRSTKNTKKGVKKDESVKARNLFQSHGFNR